MDIYFGTHSKCFSELTLSPASIYNIDIQYKNELQQTNLASKFGHRLLNRNYWIHCVKLAINHNVGSDKTQEMSK